MTQEQQQETHTVVRTSVTVTEAETKYTKYILERDRSGEWFDLLVGVIALLFIGTVLVAHFWQEIRLVLISGSVLIAVGLLLRRTSWTPPNGPGKETPPDDMATDYVAAFRRAIRTTIFTLTICIVSFCIAAAVIFAMYPQFSVLFFLGCSLSALIASALVLQDAVWLWKNQAELHRLSAR